MGRTEKYNIHTLTKEEWSKKNDQISQNEDFRNLKEQAPRNTNTQRMYSQMLRIIQKEFRDRLIKPKEKGQWDSTRAFEKKFGNHELFPSYKQAKEDNNSKEWIQIANEIRRAD